MNWFQKKLMLVFLDTEYTDPLNIELISIGMVSEDEEFSFYSERSDFNHAWCNQFVIAAVCPYLGKNPEALTNRAGLQKRLVSWFSALPHRVTIACDSFTDWELLLDSLDGVMPPNLIGRLDLNFLTAENVFNQAIYSYHAQPGHPWHHALHDAKANRMGWHAWGSTNAAELAKVNKSGEMDPGS